MHKNEDLNLEPKTHMQTRAKLYICAPIVPGEIEENKSPEMTGQSLDYFTNCLTDTGSEIKLE